MTRDIVLIFQLPNFNILNSEKLKDLIFPIGGVYLCRQGRHRAKIENPLLAGVTKLRGELHSVVSHKSV